jgi:hypothetical protein
MDRFGWIQLGLFLGLLLLLTKPMGLYLYRVLEAEGKTVLDPVLKPLERLFYRLLRIDPNAEQDWKRYTVSLLAFSLVGVVFTYAVLRLQHLSHKGEVVTLDHAHEQNRQVARDAMHPQTRLRQLVGREHIRTRAQRCVCREHARRQSLKQQRVIARDLEMPEATLRMREGERKRA